MLNEYLGFHTLVFDIFLRKRRVLIIFRHDIKKIVGNLFIFSSICPLIIYLLVAAQFRACLFLDLVLLTTL